MVYQGVLTMPRNKDFKRLIRARMQKTGEAYTAARAQLLDKPRTTRVPSGTVRSTATPSPEAPPDYAALAGYSDGIIKEKTGCTWERWVGALDALGAITMPHGDIARLVQTKYRVDGWWSQAVTVGYERIKGRRAVGQRLDGTYEASKSRTFNVPVSTLFDAWANARVRRRWLNGAKVTVRTATPSKSMRLGWPDRSIVAVWFTAKGTGRSSVALAHTRLPDRESLVRLRQYWSERLDALGDVIGERHS